jgi:hypothetical protein
VYGAARARAARHFSKSQAHSKTLTTPSAHVAQPVEILKQTKGERMKQHLSTKSSALETRPRATTERGLRKAQHPDQLSKQDHPSAHVAQPVEILKEKQRLTNEKYNHRTKSRPHKNTLGPRPSAGSEQLKTLTQFQTATTPART